MKKALITGVTGQDGSYLAEYLLQLGYRVFGFVRRTSRGRDEVIRKVLSAIEVVEGDMLDFSTIARVIHTIKPNEVYNLAAQSFVPASWEEPLLTAELTALGAQRLLEAIRLFSPASKFFQASSSEMFGITTGRQDESTPMHPRSPYGAAKLYAHHITRIYRERYGLFAVSGILFNHESPRRGEEFVTRKITLAVARIKLGLKKDKLKLGNLESRRDWGYAGDYVRAMHLMLQQEEPEDYVIATGETHSVREFVKLAFECVGLDYRDWVVVSPEYVRPSDIFELCGNPQKAIQKLGWKPEVSFEELVRMMVEHDLDYIRREYKLR